VKDVDIIGKLREVKRLPRIVLFVKVRKYTEQHGTKGLQKNLDLN
jgi:hypothetical protein